MFCPRAHAEYPRYAILNNAITYNLRPRPHNFLLPPKDKQFIYHTYAL